MVNNGPAPLSWTVVWELSEEAPGERGGGVGVMSGGAPLFLVDAGAMGVILVVPFF